MSKAPRFALALLAASCNNDDCPLRDGDEKPHIVQLEAAGEIVMALYSDGTAFCWGEAISGQCGWGIYKGLIAAAGCLSTVAPAAGGMSAGVTADGRTLVWGLEGSNEAADGPKRSDRTRRAADVLTPKLEVLSVTVLMVGATAQGDVYWWGAAITGDDEARFAELPERYPIPVPVVALKTDRGQGGACFLDETGGVWCMGQNNAGQLGLPPSKLGEFEPRRIDLPGPAVDIGAAGAQRCALLESGELYCWGYVYRWGVECMTDSCEEGHLITEVPLLMEGLRGVQLELGEAATCVLDELGKATCAGSQHAFGRGSLADPTLAPFAWEPDLSFAAVAIGLDNVCGLTTEGRVFCTGIFPYWVYNEEGYGREGAYIPIERWHEQAKREK